MSDFSQDLKSEVCHDFRISLNGYLLEACNITHFFVEF